jgi:hypothetical protein
MAITRKSAANSVVGFTRAEGRFQTSITESGNGGRDEVSTSLPDFTDADLDSPLLPLHRA